MAEYKNEALGVSFTIPDAISIRKQLQYRRAMVSAYTSEALARGNDELLTREDDFYPLFFTGAKVVIEDWKCEHLPVLNGLNFDDVTNPHVADVVFWVCNTVSGHMNRLEEVPKNS